MIGVTIKFRDLRSIGKPVGENKPEDRTLGSFGTESF